MTSQLSRGAFASSTKYLRQSKLAIPCSICRTGDLSSIRYLSFFNEIFQDLHVTTACCLSCRFHFRLSRRFHFVEKKSKTVEVSFTAACLHDSSSSYGQSLEKQYFSISRLPLRAAALIVSSSHSQCFTSLAHLRNSSLFVRATCPQNQA